MLWHYLSLNLVIFKIIENVKVAGPYLNFFINKNALTEETLKKVLKEKEKYGSSNLGKNKKIC